MNRSIAAPRFSRADIVRQAEELIDRYLAVVGKTRETIVSIGIDDVYNELIYPEYGIDLITDQHFGADPDGQKILGCFDFVSNTAFIDLCLVIGRGDARRAFTMWHEIAGHGVFQGDWLRRNFRGAAAESRLVSTDALLSPRCTEILEWQANLFAANAAAPTWLVRREIKRVFSPNKCFRFVGPCKYGLDVRGSYITRRVESAHDLCLHIARSIRFRFGGLSIESLAYRVKESGYVVDLTQRTVPLRRVARVSAETRHRQRAGSPFESLVASLS